MIAVYENNIEIIHELLKCPNININPLNAQLETPLIAACRMNNYKVAKILLDHKAIINKRYDLNGETAIFHSIRNNNKKLTSLLLENEASVAFKNKNGKSPLAIAKEYKYKGIISLLFMHFKNLSALKNKTSTLTCKKGLVDVIEKLLQCHANVNLRNDKGETALIMACWKKNINIVNRLLQTDVDINMKNNLEESPLYLSCLQNSVDIAEALLEHGADVNTCNNNNETPLMVARKNNNSKLIELLLKYGAKE
ncbi:ankyrin [Anaeromyces robustus]|uniref:Ankyrin n=1 Tax=Anaeromyces robustus TaxID=1754192 RepID=A0A1Y1X4M0_9FUNG|nr:ankyrin [Anaeromyces robustus]|eukprot:ORX80588.1 ankyrin [Anaeromyces robustus]